MRARPGAPENLALRSDERWRPPVFVARGHADGRIAGRRAAVLRSPGGIAMAGLSRRLSTASGTVVDVGCGAQPYRSVCCPPQTRVHRPRHRDARTRTSATRCPDVLTIPPTAAGRSGCLRRSRPGDRDARARRRTRRIPRRGPPPPRARRPSGPDGSVRGAVALHPTRLLAIHPSALRICSSAPVSRRRGATAVATRRPSPVTRCWRCCSRGTASRRGGLPEDPARRQATAFPFVLALASIANVSLGRPAGDDCLGYTVFARRS